MKKIMQTIIFLIVSGVYLFGTTRIGMAAVTTGKCGNNVTYSFNSVTGEMTLKGSGAMTDYSSETSMPWNGIKNKIKILTVEDGITTIGSRSFWGCSNLTKVDLPNSLKSIHVSAFQECTSLKSVMVPLGVRSLQGAVFKNCTSLTSLTLGATVLSNEVKTTTVVYGCKNLEKIRGYNGSEANTIARNCGKVFESIGSAQKLGAGDNVWACLKSDNQTVYIGGQGAAVSAITIAGASNTKSVIIRSGLTSISASCFKNFGNITGIVIPSTVKTIGSSAFENCRALTQVSLPSSITSVGSSVFKNCSALTKASLQSSQITGIGDAMFMGCEKLSEVLVSNKIVSIGNSAFDGCSILKNIPAQAQVTKIGNYAFRDCRSLSEVSFGKVTGVGIGAFQNCVQINKISLPAQTTVIGSYGFSGCSALKEIILKDGMKQIGSYAFSNCTNLTKVNVSNTMNSLGDNVFSGCTKLISLEPFTISYNDNLYYGTDSINMDSLQVSIGACRYQGMAIGNQFVVTQDNSEGEIRVKVAAGKSGGNFSKEIRIAKKQEIKDLIVQYSKDYIEEWNGISLSQLQVRAIYVDGSSKELTPKEYTITKGTVYRKGESKTYEILYTISVEDRQKEIRIPYIVDVTAPYISGIVNGKSYATAVTLLCQDSQSGVKSVWVDGKEVSLKNHRYTIIQEGRHTILVKDSCGNQTKITIRVDKSQPIISNIKQAGVYKKPVSVRIVDSNSGIQKVILNGKIQELKNQRLYISKSGKYQLTAIDYAGNRRSISFMLDNDKPVIKGVKAEKQYKKRCKITFKDKMSGILKVTINGKKLSRQIIKKGKLTIRKNGKYTLVVTDKAGNRKKVKFKVTIPQL